MVQAILSFLSAVIIIYTILCLISIFMTWIPGAKFTRFGKIISSITDPYLRVFSRRGWFRFGNIDFSPILAIGILSLVSSILGGITTTGRIYFGGILATILNMLWSVCSSLLTIFFLLILIRWIVLLANKGQVSTNSAWYQLDLMLQKFVYKLGNSFVKNNLTYQKALLISWISIGIIWVIARILFGILIMLCYKIPF
ncbi:MAG: YggT family protein [Treponema sp.]|nr:YggT family protein [Treponema sp.]